MQGAKPGKLESQINVTPLVDVVLVLLIIFMVVAPQIQARPDLQVPQTEQPAEKPDDGRQILVAIERTGVIWVDDRALSAVEFSDAMQEIALDRGDWKVVIKGDARLRFGEVQQAMLAVEAAGFANVGLITAQLDDSVGGG
ncbi:MAG: biopolymer transporter ExbD [Acidobacteriota bacterium]|nr:biopolymer transporter ExbD [Acidobacteriota bacterium]MDH3784025.1 biopolymer transporter ExbD [Acidobacteriota bacterium]